MADRVAHVVWAEPRRRFGFGVGLAALVVAAMLLKGVLSTGSTVARTVRAGGLSAKMRSIDSNVNSLISKMTVQEKFAQLTMAGPDGANGTPGPKLLAAAQAGQIGSVLDLVGVQNINQAQQAALLDDVLRDGGLQRSFAREPLSWAARLYLSDETMSIG